MKKIFLIVVVIVFCAGLFVGCKTKEDVVRIHIRANSNLSVDQDVKLRVRDRVVEYITPLIAECSDARDVKAILADNLSKVECVVENVLEESGFEYGASAEISNEFFPSRDYNGKTFGADYYDALIIKLGSGKGDNWWCVAYPPLCFVGEDVGGNGVKYKSKILELINRFRG